jgi:hypothetical protein
MDGEDIEGWPMEIGPLAAPSGGKSVRKFTSSENPLA